MNPDELRSVVLRTLSQVAPEADVDSLDPSRDVRDELDLDSMDVLRFATLLHEALGVDIPESDYAKIVSVQGAVRYLQAAKGSAS